MTYINTNLINIKESISKQRIVYKHSFSDKVWFYSYYSSIILILLIMPLAFSIKFTIEDYSTISIFSIIAFIILDYLFLYAVKNNNNLVSIKGIDITNNKELIVKYAEKIGWQIDTHRKSHTLLSKPMSILNNHWGRTIVILYDKEYIYFTCITSATISFIANSPFHWFGNRKEEKKLYTLLNDIYKTYR